MAMSDSLQASLTNEERAAAAEIGSRPNQPLEQKIEEVFRTIGDPLLSAEDVTELLVTPKERDVREALRSLVERHTLESSDKTQRPTDKEGVVLYRLSDIAEKRLRLTALEAKLAATNQSIYQW